MTKAITLILLIFFSAFQSQAQKTKIKGFMDFGMNYSPDNGDLGFVLGEQAIFFTSELTDKISFLGESVFKYSPTSSTKFTVGLERAIFKYNFKGNHSLVVGKVHTPLNYWNDSYHHGRVFFPTIGRPETFNAKIIPIHTTGIGVMGQNIWGIKFGYNVMLGNGIGATSVVDNDKYKSLTLAAHIKPIEDFRFGISAYMDKITAGSKTTGEDVSQQIFSSSLGYFKKFEFLGEFSYAMNTTDSLGRQGTNALYLYAGYKIKDVFIPYVRLDYLEFDQNEMFYNPIKTNAYTLGVRFEFNYLTVLKAEYQVAELNSSGTLGQRINLQLAIGF